MAIKRRKFSSRKIETGGKAKCSKAKIYVQSKFSDSIELQIDYEM